MILVLTGGTGGAKLVEGLAALIDPAELTIVCNTGDDCVFHGLYISPDIDTITYTLAGLSDTEKGWGLKGDTFAALEQLRRLGNDAWFNLGDKDLATHIARTRLRNEGRKLSEITDQLRRALGVSATILPMSDDRIETRVETPQGEISFQEFFVKERSTPEVFAVHLAGAEKSRPAPGVLDAIREADAIVICPSNPVTSIGPILAVPAIRDAIAGRRVRCVAVSPLIGGRAVKGPADRMLARMAGGTTPAHVASCYEGLIDALVVDEADPAGPMAVRRVVTHTLMTDLAASRRLAETALRGAA